MKSRPVGAEMYPAEGRMDGRTDGRTDRHDEANSRFSQLCETGPTKMGECEKKMYIKDWFQPLFPLPNLTPS